MSDINSNNADNTVIFSGTKEVAENLKFDEKRPNILFISIDDLNDWNEPLNGSNRVFTPFLEKFSKESVNFTKNYCASPGCNPSRASMLTGIHTYNSGMYSNYQDWRKVPVLRESIT